MSTNAVPHIDYTARDFLTIKEALKVHLQNKFPNTWRDFYESSSGIAILDIIAYSHDVLSFFLDYTANETYLTTARDRLSILQLGRLVGYQLRTATSASVECVATIPTTYTEDVVIPAGTVLSSLAGVAFVTANEFRITAGTTTGSVLFVQGVNRSETLSSDGSAWQKFILSQSSVVQGTIQVLVDGDIWTEVDSLVYADDNDKVFSVSYDENGVATILFGDSTSGRTPINAAVIEVSYRTGGGIQGNITLNQLVGTVQGQRELVFPAAYVTVTIINSAKRGSGGEEAESVTHAKLWIPAWTKANGRAVTESDYDALGNAFADPTYGAPAFAKSKLKQEIPELNTVQMYLWSRDSQGIITTPSVGLKNAVEAYFNNTGANGVRMMCTHTEVLDGKITYIDIRVAAKIATSYAQSDVVTSIQTAIDNLFTASDIIPGADFRISALYDAVHSLAGINYCLVREIVASYKSTEAIGVGTGAQFLYGTTLTLDSGSTIIPQSVKMYYGNDAEVLTDDGLGIIRTSLGVAAGTVAYDTGIISATFTAAPDVGILVYTDYRYTLDYQRGALEATGDGATSRYAGAITYPPVNPYDTVTGQKGIAFSDGTQTVIDDGAGNLTGDVDAGGRNIIDYDTGAYDFTFANPVPLSAQIMSTYRQILKTDSQDIPIDSEQLAVKGIVTIEILTA